MASIISSTAPSSSGRGVPIAFRNAGDQAEYSSRACSTARMMSWLRVSPSLTSGSWSRDSSAARIERYDHSHMARSDGREGNPMAKREVAVGDFRQRATELVRQVEETKEAITITRRGVPVAELRAVTVDPEALLGSVTYLDPDLTRPVVGPEDWEAAS
jgi:antitoxin (DNA-binding transcriptional repressor) of toxin-antitoxin stability system